MKNLFLLMVVSSSSMLISVFLGTGVIVVILCRMTYLVYKEEVIKEYITFLKLIPRQEAVLKCILIQGELDVNKLIGVKNPSVNTILFSHSRKDLEFKKFRQRRVYPV